MTAVIETLREWRQDVLQRCDQWLCYMSRVFLAREFVIDEEAVSVYEPAVSPNAMGKAPDIISAVTEMQRDQEKLSELGQLLENYQQGDSKDLDQFVRRFLARLDGFDRILEGFREMEPTGEINNWLKSLEGLYFKVCSDLKNVGLTPMEVVGHEVDLECMEVIDYRNTADYPHNTVIREMKRGYRYRGKVLRDAEVVVACNERS